MQTNQNTRQPTIEVICYEEPNESWCITFIPGEESPITDEDKKTIYVNKNHIFYENINDLMSQAANTINSKKHISTIVQGLDDFFTICFDDCTFVKGTEPGISRLMDELAKFAEKNWLEYYYDKK